jgi:hypothetical protein
MKRSAGVIAAAIVMFIGSGLDLLFWIIAIAGIAFKTAHHVGSARSIGPPGASLTLLIGASALYAGGGVLGIATGIGLLRLRNWARITTIVFASFGIFVALTVIAIFLLAPIPIPPSATPESMRRVLIVMSLVAAVPACIFLWWLIYFNASGVKAKFLGLEPLRTQSLRPLGVVIIAWVMLIGGLFSVPSAFFNVPTAFGIWLVTGATSELWRGFIAICTLAIAIGLLKWRRWAYWPAVALYGWFLIQCSIIWWTPNLIDRLMSPVNTGTYPIPLASFQPMVRWIFVASLLMNVLSLYILVTRRGAFFAACDAAKLPATSPESSVSL